MGAIILIVFIVFICVLAAGEPDKPRFGPIKMLDRETGETIVFRQDRREK